MAYKSVKPLAATDAAYIAGLVDGEGSVGLLRRHRKDERQLVISIADTERTLLEFVPSATGAGKITRKRTSAAHHTPSFVFSISNRQALDLVSQIRPFLRSYKAGRADLILRSYRELTPRNGKYDEETKAAREQFVDACMAITAVHASST